MEMSTAESMVFEAHRVVAAVLLRGTDFLRSHLSEVSEVIQKKIIPTIQYIESNNLEGTRFYPQLLEHLANLYFASDSYDPQEVIRIMEKSLTIRAAVHGNRHPCILQTVWNLSLNHQQFGSKQVAEKYLTGAHWMLHSEGIMAYPHLHQRINMINDAVKNFSKGERDFIPVSLLVPDHISSRDNALGYHLGEPFFDIYKEYCLSTGRKINLVETLIVAPSFGFYSLPLQEFQAFQDFALGRPVQPNDEKRTITFLEAYLCLDGSISPFYEITVHDRENKCLLLPSVVEATRKFEWFDYLFDDDLDLEGVF